MTRNKYAVLCALFAAATFAHATVIIPTDSSAAQGNFGTPGTTANAGYTIDVSDSNGSLTVYLHGLSGAGVVGPFANLYFDTTASTVPSSSDVGFEFGGAGDAFIPGVIGSNQFLTAGTFSQTFTSDPDGGYDATLVIANSFFETDPLGLGFTKATDGSLVSLHLSQSFSYSVVGGSNNVEFPQPAELGDVTLSNVAATPEPSSITLLGTGLLSAAGLIRRRFKS
jgi:hypothetical protein